MSRLYGWIVALSVACVVAVILGRDSIAQYVSTGSGVVYGSQIWMGAGAPSAGLGLPGDVYTNTSNGDVYRKSTGGWGSPLMNITGPQGPAGSPGTQFASAQLTTNTAGAVSWTFPAPCTSASLFWAQPIASTGTLVNVQNVGLPTSTTQAFQVNVANATVVGLIGLTILAIPASPGATTINVFCK